MSNRVVHRRAATPHELESAVRRFGSAGALRAIARRGLLPPIMGGAGFAVAQTASVLAQWSFTHSFPFASAVTAGDFLYCIGGASNYAASTLDTGITVADNINGAWTVLDNVEYTTGNRYIATFFAYIENSAAAAANGMTVTLTNPNSGTTYSMETLAVDLSGAATSSALVGHAVGHGTNPTSLNTPAVTDPGSGNLVIGYAANDSGAAVGAGAGTTLDIANNANGVGTGLAHLTTLSVAGSNAVPLTFASAPNIYQAGTVIVAAAGGAAPTPNPQVAAGFFAA